MRGQVTLIGQKLVLPSQQTCPPSCHGGIREAGLCVLPNQRRGGRVGGAILSKSQALSGRVPTASSVLLRTRSLSFPASRQSRCDLRRPAVAGETTLGDPGSWKMLTLWCPRSGSRVGTSCGKTRPPAVRSPVCGPESLRGAF